MIKITAPIHDAEDCAALIDAGAQELYCGVASESCLNVREMPWANLPDFASLRKVVLCASRRETPVFLCINIVRSGRAVPLQLEQADKALQCGISGFVVADFSLIPAIRKLDAKTKIILSTGASCTNSAAAGFYAKLGVNRVVLERQLTIGEILEIAAAADQLNLETEAFTGHIGCRNITGFCRIHNLPGTPPLLGGKSSAQGGILRRHGCWGNYTLSFKGERGDGRGPVINVEGKGAAKTRSTTSKCGVCALYYLARSHVSAVKIIGREMPADEILKNVRFVKEYLDGVRTGLIREENFIAEGAGRYAAIFGNACRKDQCYYYELRGESRRTRNSPPCG